MPRFEIRFIKHGGFQCQLFSLLSRRAAFVYCTKKPGRHFQSSDLKLLQHRGYTKKIVFVNKETWVSVVMVNYPTLPDFKDSNVFVSFPQKRNGIFFSSGVNYLHSGGNIQSE